MGSLPSSPRPMRGAIVAVDPTSPLSRIIVFQYTPDALTHSFRPREAPAEAEVGPADAHRVWGAPVQTISMRIEVDAADQLANGDPLATSSGIAPQLAALEMLLYPGTYQVITNAGLLAEGTIEILPPEGPLTVLVWGASLVVPVRLESLTVTEEAFDPALNPIRASIDLSAQVLTYSDMTITDPGYALFLTHQVLQEAMATAAAVAGGMSTLTGPVGR